MKLTSVFGDSEEIPSKYTGDGEDISPPLNMSEVPTNAKSLALIVDDPDAVSRDSWVHWVVWNIPPETLNIDEGEAPADSVIGINDFKKNSYGGPAPPSGTHRYFFKLYALDTELNLSENSGKEELEKAMEGHIIEETRLIGTYTRKNE